MSWFLAIELELGRGEDVLDAISVPVLVEVNDVEINQSHER
jgi:hypothetical protein